MIAALAAFWRGRTARERLLLQVAGALCAIAAPLWGYGAAAQFRASAAADLAAAERLRVDIAALAAAAPAGADATIRGKASAAAAASGLTIARIEPGAGDRVRIAFAPASSLSVYRWIDAVGRSGASVVETTIVRAGEGDVVAAEFEVATGP